MDSLPDELILEISQHLEPNDQGLFALSTSSKRFHHLVLPMYLEAWIDLQGLSASRDLVLRPHQLDVLAGLQTSLFIHSVKHITCSFSLSSARPDYSTADMHRFLRHIKGLAGFLSGLETVDEVTLDFKELNFWALGEHIDVLETWEAIISRLLDVVFQKSRTFNILGGMFIVHSSQFQRKIGRRETVQRPSMFHRISSLFLTKEPVVVESTSKYNLRTFNIHSRVLLLHPCYQWTLSALRTSSITSVSIMHVDIPQRSWDEILSAIHVPALEELTMDLRCNVGPAALDRFFARHPRIRILNLGRNLLPLGEDDSPLDPKCLPNLIELSASATYVRFLMMDKRSPAVRSLRLLVKVTPGVNFDATQLNQILAPCSSRLKAPLHITVAITVDHVSSHWTEFFPAQTSQKRTRSDSLQYARALEFVSTCPSDSAVESLARSLPSFPLLESASFDGCLKPGLDRQSFVSTVKSICPALQRVTVDGEVLGVVESRVVCLE
ncbi:hypothetical protein FB45DRAFT_24324 [Roridomyces roridus]|uniref:F-box domain-containing protein n=1 Tax=Roridomyces roridus TaxID=1738132 RepID=A0AAD7CK46_9AGAR|nr:hypothetical protein FB45DRAFT_24324 [Roridomyces roridus]